MKKVSSSLLVAFAIIISAVVQLKAGCDNIAGTWKFDLGGGRMAIVEYKTDGSFIQSISGITMKGTYTVKNGKLITTLDGAKAEFTIVLCKGDSMTVKRDKDGKTVVYKK
jgi:hypothetical protein